MNVVAYFIYDRFWLGFTEKFADYFPFDYYPGEWNGQGFVTLTRKQAGYVGYSNIKIGDVIIADGHELLVMNEGPESFRLLLNTPEANRLLMYNLAKDVEYTILFWSLWAMERVALHERTLQAMYREFHNEAVMA